MAQKCCIGVIMKPCHLRFRTTNSLNQGTVRGARLSSFCTPLIVSRFCPLETKQAFNNNEIDKVNVDYLGKQDIDLPMFYSIVLGKYAFNCSQKGTVTTSLAKMYVISLLFIPHPVRKL